MRCKFNNHLLSHSDLNTSTPCRACLRVCRQWKVVLLSQVSLWQTMILPPKRTLTSTSLIASFKRSRGRLKGAVINVLKDQLDLVFRLLRQNDKLQHLVLSSPQRVGPYSDARIYENLPVFPNLRSITLGDGLIVTPRSIARILVSCICLENAQFYKVFGRLQHEPLQWTNPMPCLQSLAVFCDEHDESTLRFDLLNLVGA